LKGEKGGMFYVNVEGAVLREDKWLIIRRGSKEEHAGGLLSLVGGTVENIGDKTGVLESTLHRELFEEIGVSVKNIEYVHNTSFALDKGGTVINIVFLCEWEEGEPYPKSPDEVDAIYWMTAEEVQNHPEAPPWLVDSVKEADIQRKVNKISEKFK
jgi:8-oxo-dGTP diphosphatase